MSSSVREITVNDRLRLLHDFYRPGEEQLFRFDLEDTIRKGHDFRDSIAPVSYTHLFSASGTPVVDSSASVVTQVWSYLGEVIFNLLVLVGLVKSADHIAKEMLGL